MLVFSADPSHNLHNANLLINLQARAPRETKYILQRPGHLIHNKFIFQLLYIFFHLYMYLITYLVSNNEMKMLHIISNLQLVFPNLPSKFFYQSSRYIKFKHLYHNTGQVCQVTQLLENIYLTLSIKM